jgi:hypothetical protein
MHIRNWLVCLLALALHSPALQASAKDPARGDQRIAELVAMLSGNFDAGRYRHDQKRQGVPESRIVGWINRGFHPVQAPEVGRHVMLSSSYSRRKGAWHFDEFEFLIWNLSYLPESDEILMSARSPLGASSYESSARIPGILDGITPGGMVNGVGGGACPIRWKRISGGYRGISRNCVVFSVARKQTLDWNWTYEIFEGRLEIALAGNDPQTGKLLYGTEAGRPTVLYRVIDLPEYEAARYILQNRSGETDEDVAEALLRDALKAAPNHPGANLTLAHVLSQRNQVADARPYLEKALAQRSSLSTEDQALLDATQRRLGSAPQ